MIQNRALVLTIPLHVALASALVLAGCTKGGSGNASDAAADAKGAIGDGGALAAAKPPLRPFRHGGVSGLAFNAAHEAQLTDDQAKSIEELQAKLSATDPAQRTAFTDYQTHLSAGTKTGKFDEAALKADYAAIDAVRQGEEDREAEALNALHALLTPEQRTAVVTTVRTKEAQIDQQKSPPIPDGGVDDRVKATLARMTTDLTLDASQQKRISDLLVKDEIKAATSYPARKEEQKKHADDFTSSFEQESYDAKTQTTDAGASPHEQMDKEVHFLSQLTAILKPDQREKLAAERSPAAPGQHHMVPGMGGPGGPGGPGGMPGMRPGGPGMPGAPGMPPPSLQAPPPSHS